LWYTVVTSSLLIDSPARASVHVQSSPREAVSCADFLQWRSYSK